MSIKLLHNITVGVLYVDVNVRKFPVFPNIPQRHASTYFNYTLYCDT